MTAYENVIDLVEDIERLHFTSLPEVHSLITFCQEKFMKPKKQKIR
jgi:hypothetical protein